jgi:alanyl aminopeptidase
MRHGARLSAFATMSVLALCCPPAFAAERLGTDVLPVEQRVQLELIPADTLYRGSVAIDIDVRRATDAIRLHARELRNLVVRVSGPGGDFTPAIAEGEDGAVTLRAPRMLSAGRYRIEATFTNDYDPHAKSLYRVVDSGEAYLFTQFQVDDARGAFPCFDEPSFKIPWNVELTVPAEHVAISNGPIVAEKRQGARKVVTFERTPPLSSYLVAFAVGAFDTVSVPGAIVPTRIVTVRGKGHLAAEAVRLAPPILAALERYFGRPYPYKKLDHIAVPEFLAGAMENAAAITYREERLLVEPGKTSVTQRREIARTIGHEMAHMWFGDLVTLAWWDDTWLNESFADWMGDKATIEALPEFDTDIHFLNGLQRAFDIDALASAPPIRRPVEAGGDMFFVFDPLAYEKGHAVLGMFEQWMGPETFRRAVRDYIGRYAEKNAVAADLFAAFSSAAGRDVSTAIATFLDQPGTPLVRLETLGGSRIRLTQEPYHLAGAAAPAPQARWQVPIRLSWSDGDSVRERAILLTEPSQEIQLEGGTPAWVHPNAGESGYYRWSVPPGMLARFAEEAHTLLSARERVGFLGNLSALLEADQVAGDEYLRLLQPLLADSQPQTVAAALAGLQRVRDALIDPSLEDPFAHWVRGALRPAASRSGLVPRAGEPEEVSLLRPLLLAWLADAGRDPRAQAIADSLATLVEEGAPMDAALADMAVRLSARHGDAARFARYRGLFEKAPLALERQRWLGGLGSFDDPALADSALAYTLQGPLRVPEIGTIPFTMRLRRENQDRVWRWSVANFDRIMARISPRAAARIVNMADGCSTERLAEAEKFFGPMAERQAAVRQTLDRLSDRVNACGGLREREQGSVGAYLRATAAR